jgi:DNA-binding transcriptional MerR regulator
MASAYDEIKKVLAKLRQGEPITEQNRAELNRVREMLEQQLATAELQRSDDLPPAMLKPRNAVAKNSLAARKSSEP